MRRAPGEVKMAIVEFLRTKPEGASLREIQQAVEKKLGEVAPSSVRSSLNLNSKAPKRVLERIEYGHYKLADR
jgi:site-specific DNA-methyltransferase (adenine-specific)